MSLAATLHDTAMLELLLAPTITDYGQYVLHIIHAVLSEKLLDREAENVYDLVDMALDKVKDVSVVMKICTSARGCRDLIRSVVTATNVDQVFDLMINMAALLMDRDCCRQQAQLIVAWQHLTAHPSPVETDSSIAMHELMVSMSDSRHRCLCRRRRQRSPDPQWSALHEAAARGLVNACFYLQQCLPFDVEVPIDHLGRSPLFVAAFAHQDTVVKTLLQAQRCLPPTGPGSASPLCAALLSGFQPLSWSPSLGDKHLWEMLACLSRSIHHFNAIHSSATCRITDDPSTTSSPPLTTSPSLSMTSPPDPEASDQARIRTLSALMADRSSLELSHAELLAAVVACNPAIVQWLVNTGIDLGGVYLTTTHIRKAIMLYRHGDLLTQLDLVPKFRSLQKLNTCWSLLDVVLLFASPASATSPSSQQAALQAESCCQMLLNAGCCILHPALAASKCYWRVLLSSIKDNRVVLKSLASSPDVVVQFLSANLTTTMTRFFSCVARHGKADVIDALSSRVRGILDLLTDPCNVASIENSPVHVAAHFGHEQVIKSFLRAGCPIDTMATGWPRLAKRYNVADEKWTPLQIAVLQGHTAIVSLLLNSLRQTGRSPDISSLALMAVRRGQRKVAEILLFEMTSSRSLFGDEKRDFFLHLAAVAADCGHQQLCLYLLDEVGTQALMTAFSDSTLPQQIFSAAARHGMLHVLSTLLDSVDAIDVWAADDHGMSPIDYAVACGHTTCVQFLLRLSHGVSGGSMLDCLSEKDRLRSSLCGVLPAIMETNASSLTDSTMATEEVSHRYTLPRFLFNIRSVNASGSAILMEAVRSRSHWLVKSLLAVCGPDTIAKWSLKVHTWRTRPVSTRRGPRARARSVVRSFNPINMAASLGDHQSLSLLLSALSGSLPSDVQASLSLSRQSSIQSGDVGDDLLNGDDRLLHLVDQCLSSGTPNPLLVAARAGHTECLHALMTSSIRFSPACSPGQLIHACVIGGSKDALVEVLESFPEARQELDENKFTPLMVSFLLGRYDLALVLARKEDDFSAKVIWEFKKLQKMLPCFRGGPQRALFQKAGRFSNACTARSLMEESGGMVALGIPNIVKWCAKQPIAGELFLLLRSFCPELLKSVPADAVVFFARRAQPAVLSTILEVVGINSLRSAYLSEVLGWACQRGLQSIVESILDQVPKESFPKLLRLHRCSPADVALAFGHRDLGVRLLSFSSQTPCLASLSRVLPHRTSWLIGASHTSKWWTQSTRKLVECSRFARLTGAGTWLGAQWSSEEMAIISKHHSDLGDVSLQDTLQQFSVAGHHMSIDWRSFQNVIGDHYSKYLEFEAIVLSLCIPDLVNALSKLSSAQSVGERRRSTSPVSSVIACVDKGKTPASVKLSDDGVLCYTVAFDVERGTAFSPDLNSFLWRLFGHRELLRRVKRAPLPSVLFLEKTGLALTIDWASVSSTLLDEWPLKTAVENLLPSSPELAENALAGLARHCSLIHSWCDNIVQNVGTSLGCPKRILRQLAQQVCVIYCQDVQSMNEAASRNDGGVVYWPFTIDQNSQIILPKFGDRLFVSHLRCLLREAIHCGLALRTMCSVLGVKIGQFEMDLQDCRSVSAEARPHLWQSVQQVVSSFEGLFAAAQGKTILTNIPWPRRLSSLVANINRLEFHLASSIDQVRYELLDRVLHCHILPEGRPGAVYVVPSLPAFLTSLVADDIRTQGGLSGYEQRWGSSHARFRRFVTQVANVLDVDVLLDTSELFAEEANMSNACQKQHCQELTRCPTDSDQTYHEQVTVDEAASCGRCISPANVRLVAALHNLLSGRVYDVRSLLATIMQANILALVRDKAAYLQLYKKLFSGKKRQIYCLWPNQDIVDAMACVDKSVILSVGLADRPAVHRHGDHKELLRITTVATSTSIQRLPITLSTSRNDYQALELLSHLSLFSERLERQLKRKSHIRVSAMFDIQCDSHSLSSLLTDNGLYRLTRIYDAIANAYKLVLRFLWCLADSRPSFVSHVTYGRHRVSLRSHWCRPLLKRIASNVSIVICPSPTDPAHCPPVVSCQNGKLSVVLCALCDTAEHIRSSIAIDESSIASCLLQELNRYLEKEMLAAIGLQARNHVKKRFTASGALSSLPSVTFDTNALHCPVALWSGDEHRKEWCPSLWLLLSVCTRPTNSVIADVIVALETIAGMRSMDSASYQHFSADTLLSVQLSSISSRSQLAVTDEEKTLTINVSPWQPRVNPSDVIRHFVGLLSNTTSPIDMMSSLSIHGPAVTFSPLLQFSQGLFFPVVNKEEHFVLQPLNATGLPVATANCGDVEVGFCRLSKPRSAVTRRDWCWCQGVCQDDGTVRVSWRPQRKGVHVVRLRHNGHLKEIQGVDCVLVVSRSHGNTKLDARILSATVPFTCVVRTCCSGVTPGKRSSALVPKSSIANMTSWYLWSASVMVQVPKDCRSFPVRDESVFRLGTNLHRVSLLVTRAGSNSLTAHCLECYKPAQIVADNKVFNNELPITVIVHPGPAYSNRCVVNPLRGK